MGNWNNKILTNQQNIEPKEIFKAYCAEIGHYYSQSGFKYLKAKPRIERQTNDIIECVTFWTSRVNEKNEYVHLELLPYIRSKALKKWIKETQIGRNEFKNISGILSSSEYDGGIIADNFISYLCMIKSEYLEQALKKYSYKLTDEFISQIEMIRAASN